MKKKLVLLPLLISGFIFAQQNSTFKEDSLQFRGIAKEVMNHSNAYNNLHSLTKDIGARLSGSDAYEKAVEWSVQKLKEAGADKVWKQPVMIPVWERGTESLHFKNEQGKWEKVKMLSLGNSEGTQGKDLIAEVIVVKNFEEFNQLKPEQVKGKIVLFNYPFKKEFINTFEAYSDASKYRSQSASAVAKKGGIGVIVRSMSTADSDVPHTGGMRYENGLPKIPAIAIGTKTADQLEKISRSKKLTVKINSNCGMKGEKSSYNVIGELTGKNSDKKIIIAGHLDSWDVGEGAHDDGTGIVQSIEVLRAFKQLKLQNNHTIRVICYANEENGVKGGTTYADELNSEKEPHIFAIESDAGGFSPRGFSLDMDAEKKAQIQSWSNLFAPYQIVDFTRIGGGVDIGPLKKHKVPLAGLLPDSQRYFDLHHSEEDTFEKVNKRELNLGASAMTQLVYMIDKYWK